MSGKVYDFDYCTPTKIIFGRDKIASLPEVIASFGKRVLLVYGGGSIKSIGLYDKIKELLKDFELYELSGVEPNPKVTSVNAGAQICKEHDIDVVLAAGGGSVLDCSKAICAARYYQGDAWDLVLDNSKVSKALPLVCVLTLAATGSEYDAGAVISNWDTKQKLPLMSELLFPKVSICDPAYTFTVSKKQTAAGTSDILSHLLEQYFVPRSNAVADGLLEGVMKAVIATAPTAYEHGDDYEARAVLMWASSLACNGILGAGGAPQAWVCHAIEHEISAFYDITHGDGLAIVTPYFMRYSFNDDNIERFASFARGVFAVPNHDDPYVTAEKGVLALEAFYASLNLPRTLKDVGITSDEHFEAMADSVTAHWNLASAIKSLNRQDIINILQNALG